VSTTSAASAAAFAANTASIAYDSSLNHLNVNVVMRAFTSATHDAFSGTSSPSKTLKTDIAAGDIKPNVFEAVGAENITPLEPKHTTWYIQYAAITAHGSPRDIDITIIGTPTPGGIAFVKYTLSPAGLAQYKAAGFTILTPKLFGSKSDVPTAIAGELKG
jgi:hypothetical protein